MADQPVAIDGIDDPSQVRVMLYASGRPIHAPLDAVSDVTIPASIHAAPSKAVPVDADEFGIADSAAGFSLAKLTWANLKEGMRAFFYGANKVTPVDGDVFGMLDSTTSFSPKYSTWAQIKAVLKTYFDTLYVALTGNQTVAGIKTFSSIPVLSGGAIAFPATQVPSAGANDLDDYEEGALTPALTFVGGNTGITYVRQGGRYTKIGNLVTVNFEVFLSSKGSSTGAAAITGLPFTPSATAGDYSTNAPWFTGMTGLTGVLIGIVNLGVPSVSLNQTSATGITAITDATFTNSSRIICSFTYHV